MKKCLVLIAVLTTCLSCNMLGIGKQCYTCTTEDMFRSSAQKVTKEVCGNDEMKKYEKDNTKSGPGYFISTTCKKK